MKHYLLSIYQPDEGAPDDLDEIMRDLAALNDEMRAAGTWVFAAGLHAPSTATVLRAEGDDLLITDGPYVEGKEHIGGFTVIRAADLDEALEWGRRLAAVVTLPIEVRPIQDA
ncbi:YciI family protein [Nocardia beijingensis]|uniref:YciI family protein n=1 Tax=Nocardia beijingensis TaxID=95162 RepID=UPI000829D3B0|nr:YciI family protein [Nocardia beijingensis]